MNSYMRTWSFLFGIGLGILWIAGLSAPNSTPWLTWLDGVAALCAFFLATGATERARRSARMSGPAALSIGLFALWIIGLVTNGALWQDWWTFAFACAFALVALAAARPSAGVKRVTHAQEEHDEFRKSA